LSKIGNQLAELRKAKDAVDDQMAQRAAMETDPMRLAQAYFQRGCVLGALKEIERGGTPLLGDLRVEQFRITLLLEAGRVEEAYEAAGRFAAAAEQAQFPNWE